MTPSNSMLSSWTFDFVSGYQHKPVPPGSNMSLEELRKGGHILDEKQWLTVRLSKLRSSPGLTMFPF